MTCTTPTSDTVSFIITHWAEVDGGADAFTVLKLLLKKPRWLEDSQVSFCGLCNQPFSRIRRKHHCRQCGGIFCANCSSEKVELPHLGYTSKERVCSTCKDLANCMFMIASSSQAVQLQGAKALNEKCTDSEECKKMFEYGGVHALISLARSTNDDIKKEVSQALNALAEKPGAQKVLADLGTIKALSSLVNTSPHDLNLQINCVKSMCELCSNSEVQQTAAEHGILPLLVSLFRSPHDLIIYRSAFCVMLLAQNPNTHQTFISNDASLVKSIVSMLSHSHEEVLENILMSLCSLSCYNETLRSLVAQELCSTGGSLATILSGRFSPVVINGAVCLLGNMALVPAFVGNFRQELFILCQMLEQSDQDIRSSVNLARALANFASFQANADILSMCLAHVAGQILSSLDLSVKRYGYRCMLHMLKYNPQASIAALTRYGVQEFLQCVSEDPQGLDQLISNSCAAGASFSHC